MSPSPARNFAPADCRVGSLRLRHHGRRAIAIARQENLRDRPRFDARHHLAACRPYFRSEDRWAGRAAAGRRYRHRTGDRRHQRADQSMECALLQRAAGQNWDAFVSELLFFCVLAAVFIVLAVYQLYLNQWLQIRWRRWMTQQLSRRLARRRQPLPHAAARRRRRQPRPAHRRRHQAVHREDVCSSAWAAQLHGHARLVRHRSCGCCRRAAPLTLFGINWAIPGYLVWAALIYSIAGTALTHWIGRPLVALNFTAAALRGRFPLQSRAGAREFRADRACWRGENAETRAAAGSLRPRGRQLDADHVAAPRGSPSSPPAIRRSRPCFRIASSARPISPARFSSAA